MLISFIAILECLFCTIYGYLGITYLPIIYNGEYLNLHLLGILKDILPSLVYSACEMSKVTPMCTRD